MTGAATLDNGRQPNGIALRFADTTIWLALANSDWVTDEAMLRGRRYKVSRWFADEFDGRSPLE